ncbi:MAG: hypothetical protein WD668_07040, partial [Saccharospirillum sp.]
MAPEDTADKESNPYTLELIQPADNAAMAIVIRQGLKEFGANRPGFAWQDPELDDLSRAYSGD